MSEITIQAPGPGQVTVVASDGTVFAYEHVDRGAVMSAPCIIHHIARKLDRQIHAIRQQATATRPEPVAHEDRLPPIPPGFAMSNPDGSPTYGPGPLYPDGPPLVRDITSTPAQPYRPGIARFECDHQASNFRPCPEGCNDGQPITDELIAPGKHRDGAHEEGGHRHA